MRNKLPKSEWDWVRKSLPTQRKVFPANPGGWEVQGPLCHVPAGPSVAFAPASPWPGLSIRKHKHNPCWWLLRKLQRFNLICAPLNRVVSKSAHNPRATSWSAMNSNTAAPTWTNNLGVVLPAKMPFFLLHFGYNCSFGGQITGDQSCTGRQKPVVNHRNKII